MMQRGRVLHGKKSAVIQLINEGIHRLSEREQTILRMRFGITSDGYISTLAEVACQVGLSTERIRQLESMALNKLAVNKCGHYLHTYLHKDEE